MLAARRPAWSDVGLTILGYVLLDWASYIHPLHGLNITPWNPAPALAIVCLLRFGKRVVAPIVLAIVLAETWVRGLPVAFPVTLGLAVLLTACYAAVAAAMAHFLPAGKTFANQKGLLLWTTIVAIGTLLSSGVFVVTLHLSGYIPAAELAAALLQYWVGDGAGVLVAMPLIWMLIDRERRRNLQELVFRSASFGHLAAALLALAIAFGIGEVPGSSYLYVLFLPVAWAASHRGLPGAIVAAATVQVGVIAMIRWQDIATLTVLEIQVLAAAIALFGFFIGIVVDEKQRISDDLRRTLRLAAAGEMAGALAHELNQPLTALSAYGSACEQLMARGETGARLRDAVNSMTRESFHAAEVLRRLRDFFRTGSTRLENVPLPALVSGSVASIAARAERESVRMVVSAIPDCVLFGDPLQLEVVLRNLLTNAIEAVADRPPAERSVAISARIDDARVVVSVEDTGPGFTAAQQATLFEGFRSSKATGMGLGLVISRAIVETHGGSLWAESGGHGVLRLALPIEENSSHAV